MKYITKITPYRRTKQFDTLKIISPIKMHGEKIEARRKVVLTKYIHGLHCLTALEFAFGISNHFIANT